MYTYVISNMAHPLYFTKFLYYNLIPHLMIDYIFFMLSRDIWLEIGGTPIIYNRCT
jgi:hypothetical protein